MPSFSREAAATYAQNEIQQKRIQRIKAVREKERKMAKQQTASYSELKQSAQKQIEHEVHQQWQTQKNQQLLKLKAQYSKLRSSSGIAHKTAHKTTQVMHATAVMNEKRLQKHKRIATQRAHSALSKLQQKILNEQNQRDVRAKWRSDAIKLAEYHRSKLAEQLQLQYIILPPGLSPKYPPNNNNNNNNNNKRRNLINSDPRFNQSHRYTLVTANNKRSQTALNSDAPSFNPHPKLFLREMDENQAIDADEDQSKVYNLKEYLPPKLLKRLSKKYSTKHKKQKRKKKKQQKFKAAGIRLKCDESHMKSIPEEKTLSEQGSVSSKSKFHSIPSHIQANERKKCETDTVNTANPWIKATEIRQQTAEKEKKQTQQFLKAQKRGKIALDKEIQKTKTKQLECDLELIHQKLIQEKLQKCQKLIESTNSSNKLQAELEENFEDLFQIHSKSDESNKENIQNINVENQANRHRIEECKAMELEMKPRNSIPQPQSYSSSSSQSVSPPNINKKPKKKLQVHPRKHLQKDVARKAISIPTPISVSIPTVKPCDVKPPKQLNNAIQQRILHSDNDMKENLSSSDDDDDDEQHLSVTRSRRVKIQKNNDGSTSVSESTSIATSVSCSPRKENNNTTDKDDDEVIVPRKWFESLLQQIDNGSPSVMTSASSISSQTLNLADLNVKTHGKHQVAMKRTWFEQLLQDVYKKEKDEDIKNINEEDNELKNDDEEVMNIHEDEEDKQEMKTEPKEAQHTEHKQISNAGNIGALAESESEDEYNLIFKRKKPISVLSEMLSDTDANDADDEYDPNQKPNNLRQSIDSDASQMDNESMSTLNIRNANKFIRESEVLLNQTANFFDNFSDGSSSMDFGKMDKSVKNKNDMDSLLRSSVQSDSSQWSLSSLSSMEFTTLPASLQKLDQFLSDNKSKKSEPKNTKTPMQTIKEMSTPSSSSSFTIHSRINEEDDSHTKSTTKTPNTPKPFVQSAINYNSHHTKHINNESTLEYHSEEEKAASPTNDIKNNTTDNKLITPSTYDSTYQPSNPRFTDGTMTSYPSLPPSNRGSVLKDICAQTQNNQSLLPIKQLDFMDINVSNIHTNSSNSISAQEAKAPTISEQNSITIDELKKFNDEMNDTLKQILELKISRVSNEDNESFLDSMRTTDDQNRNVFDSINVSEIEVSKSDHTPAKSSQLTTSSFSTSTFMNDVPLPDSVQKSDVDTSTLSSMSLTRIQTSLPKMNFPPLTPQDLMANCNMYKRAELDDTEEDDDDDDDMELDTDTQSSHTTLTQQTLERQNAGYFDADEEDEALHKIPTDMNMNQNQSFQFKFDLMNSLDDYMMRNMNNDNDIMCVGDLEIVKEEPESESNKNYAEFVGNDSEITENDSDLQDISMQNAWRSSDTKRALNDKIGNKLEILKQREKQKKMSSSLHLDSMADVY